MGIENWSQDVILVGLSSGLEITDEITAVAEMVRAERRCDVIIDFARVDTVTSPVISELAKLRELLTECERRLVLCNVSALIRGIFTVTGLKDAFAIVDDPHVALASL